MAYIAQTSIRSDSHMEHAVDYITKEEKALPLSDMKKYLNTHLIHMGTVNASVGERATYINCSSQNTHKDFDNLRKAFNQDKGVIAHHYYQSFQKDDNITPEQAHKIGVELAKKMFPNYQVVVATHTDREHLHNHIIVNSCNMITGQKWHSNKASLTEMRKESDKLCLANGLGTIMKNSKYKGIDRTTYQLGLKGKSWKIGLVRNLDTAVQQCKSKAEFISFLNNKDYTVRYTNQHITIKKNGEKKGIRVDTLAKQFGEKYTKENLEKMMGYFVRQTAPETKKHSQPEKKVRRYKTKSNWNYYEEWTFKQKNYFPSKPEHIVRDYQTERMINIAERSVINSHNPFDFIIKMFMLMFAVSHRKKKKVYPKRYKRIQTIPINREHISFGNIKYQELVQSAGDNYSIKVTMDKLLRIANQPILYSARVSKKTSSVTITVKEKDREFLAELLDLNNMQANLDAQNESIRNKNTYRELKEQAENSNCKLQYLIINEEQKKILQENYIDFAYFDKDGKINIAFLPDKVELIKKLIYQHNEDKPIETEQHKNNRLYAELKKNAALAGEKLRYQTKISKEDIIKLRKEKIVFAYFVNAEDKTKFNIAYEKKNEDKIKAIISTVNKPTLS